MLRKPSLVGFVNHRAGRGTRRAGLGRVVGEMLVRPPNPQRIYHPTTIEELRATARDIMGARPDIVAICAGDGTIHETLTAMLRERATENAPLPDILIVPLGTMNNVAEEFGITRHDPVRFAARIQEKNQRGLAFDYIHARPLAVNGEIGFLYGAGIPAHLLRRYYANPARTGALRAAEVVLETLWDELIGLLPGRTPHHYLTEPIRARIVANASDAVVDAHNTYTGLMVGAISRVGAGCRALPRAMDDPERFMLRATRLSFWGLLRNFLPMYLGQRIADTDDAVCTHLTIEYDRPTITQVDGELKPPTTRNVITCGPILRFITG